MQINGRGDSPRRSHAERRATTQRAFLDAGRKLFAEEGFSQISIEAIVREAGVTRGALYHYFEDKAALFRAVAEELNEQIDASVVEAARAEYAESNDPLEMFMVGTSAYLSACLRPEVRQIILLDGPAVLGWEAWHEMDASHALAQIEAGLEVLIRNEVMESQPKRLLAHLIHGALIEAAMYVASSEAPQEAKDEAGDGLKRLMEGLCGRGSAPGSREGEN